MTGGPFSMSGGGLSVRDKDPRSTGAPLRGHPPDGLPPLQPHHGQPVRRRLDHVITAHRSPAAAAAAADNHRTAARLLCSERSWRWCLCGRRPRRHVRGPWWAVQPRGKYPLPGVRGDGQPGDDGLSFGAQALPGTIVWGE